MNQLRIFNSKRNCSLLSPKLGNNQHFAFNDKNIIFNSWTMTKEEKYYLPFVLKLSCFKKYYHKNMKIKEDGKENIYNS